MLTIKIDTAPLTADLTNLQQRQIPFATAKALNALALDVQVAQQNQLRSAFTLRRETWAMRSVKITHFATKAQPHATVGIVPPGMGRVDLLGKFETDTQKRALSSSHGIAVPIGARRSKRDIVMAAQKPGALNLHREGGRVVGDHGTYIVKLSGGRELLIQRKDLGKRAAKKAGRGTVGRGVVLFLFTRAVPITPNLRFAPTAALVIDRMWEQRMGEALALALATAR